MIIHTIVPPELLLQSMEMEENTEQLFIYQGIPVAAQPLNNMEWKITKVMSTDPEHYLHEQIYPGATMRIW